MGHPKNAAKKRTANLPPCPLEASLPPPRTSPADSDIALDMEYTPANSDEGSFETALEDEEDQLEEIRNDSDLLAFSAKLQAAHDLMMETEKEQRAATKRKAHYDGNSSRTKSWRRLEGKRMEKAGFQSVTCFFKKQTDMMETNNEQVMLNTADSGTR